MKPSRLTGVAATGTAAALVVGLLAPAAFAGSPTFTVKAGKAKSGSVAFAGKTKGKKPQVKLVDKTSGTTLTCTSAGATGTVTVGKHVSGKKLGTISGPGTTWKGCTGPLSLALNPVGSGAWKLKATSYKKGVTKGKITGIHATVAANTASQCSFSVTGSVPVSYTNKTGILALSGKKADLTIADVKGCFGAVANGDKSAFAAKYLLKLSKKHSPLTIKG